MFAGRCLDGVCLGCIGGCAGSGATGECFCFYSSFIGADEKGIVFLDKGSIGIVLFAEGWAKGVDGGLGDVVDKGKNVGDASVDDEGVLGEDFGSAHGGCDDVVL